MDNFVVLLETLQKLGREFAEPAAVWFDGGSARYLLNLGVNSIDIMNFGHESGHETEPRSGPNLVLGHYKFRYVARLQA